MKKLIRMMICTAFAVAVLLPVMPAFAASIQVVLPTFPVALNGVQIENATRQYPLIVYTAVQLTNNLQ